MRMKFSDRQTARERLVDQCSGMFQTGDNVVPEVNADRAAISAGQRLKVADGLRAVRAR